MSHTIKHGDWAMIFNSDMSGEVRFVNDDIGPTVWNDELINPHSSVKIDVPGELIQRYVARYVGQLGIDSHYTNMLHQLLQDVVDHHQRWNGDEHGQGLEDRQKLDKRLRAAGIEVR